MNRDWLGIPEGYGWSRLSFDATSGTLVVELRSKSLGADFVPTRLFTRHLNEQDYRPVVEWDKTLSSESVVFAGNGSLAAFNSVRYTKIEDDRVSGDWNGAYLWDMRKQEVTCCVDPTTLAIPSGFERGWATNILGIAADAEHLYFQLGVQEKGGRCLYHVAALNLETKNLDLMSPLKATFY